MKSLQNQYNLIKEGKGNKETFLKEAKTLFPNVVTNVLTYDQAIHNLTERGIISEGFIGVSSQRAIEPNWFKIFNENVDVKATLKQTDKSVEEKETAGYDYKDKKSNNNISTAEILTGYYAEMKNPKNADKTETEIKAIVFKNLEKDPLHYVKGGQFGLEGVGYTEEAPGLGKPKEAKGKYKSSGMEPVKLNEVFYGSSDGDHEAAQEDIQMAEYYYDKGLQAYREGDYLKADSYYTRALRHGTHVGWTEKDLPPYGTVKENYNPKKLKEGKVSDVSFDYKLEEVTLSGEIYNIKMTVDATVTMGAEDDVTWSVESIDSIEKYNKSTKKYEPVTLTTEEEEKLKKELEGIGGTIDDNITDEALDLGYGEKEPDYPEDYLEEADDVKKKLMPNKQKGIADSIEIKSTLEKVAPKLWAESDINKAKEILKKHIEDSGMNDTSKKTMLYNLSTINTKSKLDYYVANALLKYEKLSVKEGMVSELNLNIPQSLKDMIEDATKESENGYVQHIEYAGPGKYRISDWFDSDNTIYSVEDGRVLLDKTNEIDIEGNRKGAMNENLTPANIKWNYPDVDNKDNIYYEPNPESKNYTISLPITGVTSDGKTVKGTYTKDVPDMSAETLDDLDINPKYINIDEETVREIRKSKKTLAEAKKRAIEKHLKEIEKLGEIAAIDHKIEKIQEKIEELKNKITMTEGDDLAEMVDKNAVKEIKKDIALLERRKKMAEAQKARLGKKVSGQGKPQTHAGGGYETGMMESREEEEGEKAKEMARSAMKRAIGLGGKSKSWEDTVKDVLAAKNVKK